MRRMLWQVSYALLLMLCSIVGEARAQEITPRCPAPSTTILLNMMRHTPGAVIRELRGDEATVAIGIFNLLPPVGDERGDRFYIALLPGAPLAHLLVASHGCIENGAVVDIHTAAVIENAAKKVGAGISL